MLALCLKALNVIVQLYMMFSVLVVNCTWINAALVLYKVLHFTESSKMKIFRRTCTLFKIRVTVGFPASMCQMMLKIRPWQSTIIIKSMIPSHFLNKGKLFCDAVCISRYYSIFIDISLCVCYKHDTCKQEGTERPTVDDIFANTSQELQFAEVSIRTEMTLQDIQRFVN